MRSFSRFVLSRALAGSLHGLPVRGTALVLALALGVAACAGTNDDTKPITYSLTAKQNYDRGVVSLKDENYNEALHYFQFVKTKFPFSKYAVMAELAIADTQYARGTYTEAADSYKSFLRLHPTHEKVENGFVSFRIGACSFKDMPDSVFILPPSYEKDQGAVNEALRAMDEFQKRYPDSPYLAESQKLRKEVLNRLVDHEVYVARFYLDHDHPKAAARRLKGALTLYPGSGREGEILLALGQTYLSMNDPLSARDTFARVVTEHKDGEEARRATLYLEFIRGHYGEPPVPKTASSG